MTVIPAFAQPTAEGSSVALARYAQLIVPGVAVVGGFWIGSFGCTLMGVASALTEGVYRWKRSN